MSRERPLPSMFHVARLVIGLSLQRYINRFVVGKKKKSLQPSRRSATARKSSSARIIAAIISILVVVVGTAQWAKPLHFFAMQAARYEQPHFVFVDEKSLQSLGWIEESLTEARSEEEQKDARERLDDRLESQAVSESWFNHQQTHERKAELLRIFAERGSSAFKLSPVPLRIPVWPDKEFWYGPPDSQDMLGPLFLIVFALSIAVVLISIAGPGHDLTKTDWIWEWWMTFPVSARGLLLARIFETAFTNLYAWLLLFPVYVSIFVCGGNGWFSLALAWIAITSVSLFAGSVRVLVEVGLPQLFSMRTIHRLQVVLAVISIVPLLVPVAATQARWLNEIFLFGRTLPSAIVAHPFSPLLLGAGGLSAFTAIVGCLTMTALVVFGVTQLGTWLLRDGLVGSAFGSGKPQRRAQRLPDRSSWEVSLVARKELLFVFRNRALFGQTFVMPIALVAMAWLAAPQFVAEISADPQHAAAIAFMIAAFILLSGALNSFALESSALWILFSIPKQLTRVLVDKALFWCSLSTFVSVTTFIVLVAPHGPTWSSAAGPFLMVTLGIVLLALIAVAISFLGTDPLDTSSHKIDSSFHFLFMGVAGSFSQALYAPSWWPKFVHIVLTALLALALWQKLHDKAPYLLDPNAEPPPRVDVADGMLAAFSFFVLQAMIALMLKKAGVTESVRLLLAFSFAGLVIAATTVFLLQRNKTPDWSSTLGLVFPTRHPLQVLSLAVGGGLLGTALAVPYLMLVDRIDFLKSLRDSAVSPLDFSGPGAIWLALLAIVAAPIFEEFIFRGTLYSGLRRSVGIPGATIISALVFGIIHPAIASVPVFVIGVLTARAFQKTGSLLPAIVVHMTYNASLVAVNRLAQT